MPLQPGSGDWINADLTSSWVNFGTTYAPASYALIQRTVFLRGALTSLGGNTTIFTLPVGYRPPFDGIFSVASRTTGGAWSAGLLVIRSTGAVLYLIGGGNYFGLDGVCFRV